ncbi:MAG: hypothetical protein R2856_29340 [Caldilineaceae bacterium]
MNDINLLQRYEPVVCYTEGELFFPCAVDDYLTRCSLWQIGKGGDARRLAVPGDLSAATLGNYGDRCGWTALSTICGRTTRSTGLPALAQP